MGKVELQTGGWARSAMPVVLFSPLNAVLKHTINKLPRALAQLFQIKTLPCPLRIIDIIFQKFSKIPLPKYISLARGYISLSAELWFVGLGFFFFML